MNHHRAYSHLQGCCGDLLKGIDPSTNHRTASTLVYKGCDSSSKRVDSENKSRHGVYSHLQGLP